MSVGRLQPVRLLGVLIACIHFWVALASDESCSADRYPGLENADVKLAAIVGIRQIRGGVCSQPSEAAIQIAVALNWATSLLNGDINNESFVPGIRIGVDVYDNCFTTYLSAKHAGMLATEHQGIQECPLGGNGSVRLMQAPLAGIIGTFQSQSTTIVADVINQVHVPLVGISATLPELSNKTRYPGFSRAVPSDLKQAQVIISLAKTFGWSYVVGAHTSDSYGRSGMAKLRTLAREEKICLTSVTEFPANTELDPDMMETFVRETLFGHVTKSRKAIGVVFFGNGSVLRTLLTFIQTRRSEWHNALFYLRRIYWIGSDGVDASTELATRLQVYQTKILLVGPPRVDMPSFVDYYMSYLANPPGPWRQVLKEVVSSDYDCPGYNFTIESLEPCDIKSRIRIPSYIASALDAVYLIANSLKTLHSQHCSSPGLCGGMEEVLQQGLLKYHQIPDLNYTGLGPLFSPPEFFQNARYLQNLFGDFEPKDNILYSIQANEGSRFVQVGEFRNNAVTMQPGIVQSVKPSECLDVCEECKYIDTFSYLFSPGQPVILGIYSIHLSGPGFGCAEYRKSVSYIAMEAFINAINQLREMTGIPFGYLIIDDCYNPLTASRMLVKVLSGDLIVTDRATGQVLDPASISVAVGATSSPVTMAAMHILQYLNIPAVSFSATTPELDNHVTYPYFSRTVSSDSEQARVITLILKNLRVTHVGAIIIKNSYGLELYKHFRIMAEMEEICVENAFEMTVDTPATDIEQALFYARFRGIKVIVVFTTSTIASNILDSVDQDDMFTFIASEAWGSNAEIIRGDRGERARGSLVLGASTAVELDYGLKEHLQSLEPFHEGVHGWLKEFWQNLFSCDLPGGFDNVNGRLCQQNEHLSESMLRDLTTSAYSVHSTMATLSAGLAIKSLQESKASTPYPPEDITKAIREVRLTSSQGTSFKPFADSENGNSGFQIYNVQKSGDSYVYKLVGEYKANGDLRIDWSQVKFYSLTGQVIYNITSSCLYRRECRVCADVPTTESPNTGSTDTNKNSETDDSSSSAEIIALAVICALLFIIVLVFVVILICCFRRKHPQKVPQVLSGLKAGASNSGPTGNSYSDSMSSDLSLSTAAKPSLPAPRDVLVTDGAPPLPRPHVTPNHVQSTCSSDSTGTPTSTVSSSKQQPIPPPAQIPVHAMVHNPENPAFVLRPQLLNSPQNMSAGTAMSKQDVGMRPYLGLYSNSPDGEYIGTQVSPRSQITFDNMSDVVYTISPTHEGDLNTLGMNPATFVPCRNVLSLNGAQITALPINPPVQMNDVHDGYKMDPASRLLQNVSNPHHAFHQQSFVSSNTSSDPPDVLPHTDTRSSPIGKAHTSSPAPAPHVLQSKYLSDYITPTDPPYAVGGGGPNENVRGLNQVLENSSPEVPISTGWIVEDVVAEPRQKSREKFQLAQQEVNSSVHPPSLSSHQLQNNKVHNTRNNGHVGPNANNPSEMQEMTAKQPQPQLRPSSDQLVFSPVRLSHLHNMDKISDV